MSSEYVGTAVFKLRLDAGDAEKQLKETMSGFSSASKDGEESVKTLDDSIANLTLGVNLLKQAFGGLQGGVDFIGDLIDSSNQYEAAMNGVASVASATGNSVAESMQVVKDASANGLVRQADAAAAVKNLELYGLTAEQAAQMIRVMTDAAVYNRQESYSLSEAVRVTTEGIRMENSVLSDAGGITKNIAKMHEEYAAQLGKSANNLTDAEKAQAVYNGVLAEGSTYLGDAEGYTETMAGAQDKLGTAIEQVKVNLGGLFDDLSPIVNGLADWLNHNQALVAGILAFVGVVAAAGGLISTIALAKKAIGAISQSIAIFSTVSKLATGGIVGLVVGLGALAAGVAAASVLTSTADAEADLADKANAANKKIDDQSDSIDKTAKKIASLREQLEKLTRDYQRDLKQIAVDHENNLLELNKQIEEANIDYRRAIDERMADFNVSLAKQEREHQELVDELSGQLAFLQRYNNDYNKQKLAQVQFALAKEQQLYENETARQREEIELQNQADKEKLDTKLASLQQELDDELAFMNKHRDELNSVRDVILLDEIESLNERYQEQKKSYEKQIVEAEISGSKIGGALGDSINKALKEALKKFNADKAGADIGSNMIGGIMDSLYNGAVGIGNFFESIGKSIGNRFYNLFNGNGFDDRKYNYINGSWKLASSGYASGGYTGRGAVDEVAGVVHKGEFVVPANQVDQSTGTPKLGGDTFVINLSGVLATSAQAKRELAADLQTAIKQTKQARIGA